MVFSSNELDFLILQNGKDGTPSESRYIWVKYSKYEDGTELTDSPDGATYIGIAYNKDSAEESNNPSDYTWVKIQGEKGEIGDSGYTIILQNENISIATDKDGIVLVDQTFYSTVRMMQGVQEITNFKIGEIKSDDNITTMKNEKTITISVSKGTKLATENGYINVPIFIGEIAFEKDISWALAKQGLDGVEGTPALNIVVGNETQNIPCTEEGVVSEPMLIEIPFSGYKGFEKVNCSVAVGVLPTGVTVGQINSSTPEKDGLIILNVAAGADFGGKNILNGKVVLTFTLEGNVIVKHFTWGKTKDGAEGSVTLYTLSSSAPVLFKQYDESITPTEITFNSFVRNKDSIENKPYDGMFVIAESNDGVTYNTKYLSTKNENSITYTLSSTFIMSLRCTLCETDKISKELDVITVPVLTNEGLKEEIVKITNSVSEVTSEVDSVKKSITNKVWQSDVITEINKYDQTTVKILRDQFAEQIIEMGQISSKVSNVETKLEEKADGSTVHELEEKVAEMELTADGFKQTVEKNYAKKSELEETTETIRSEFNQKAGEIETKVDNLEGDVTEVKQTNEQISSKVENHDGDITNLKQQADRFEQDVSDMEGNLSEIEQLAKSIELSVQNKQDLIPYKIRYVRDWLNGNNIDSQNRFVGIEINSNETNLESGNINLALGKTPTSDVYITNASYYTDGSLDTYASLGSGEHYLQIDLGENNNSNVDSITVWHYFQDGRTYNHKLQVSMDGELWYTLYDSEVYGKYSETSNGKTYYIDDSVTDKKLAFIKVDVENISQRVQENENNFASINTQFNEITQRVESVESTNQQIQSKDLPELENNLDKKIAEIKVTAENITNTVESIEGEVKKQAQEILEAGEWKVSLANIGAYDESYATEVVSMSLNYDGMTIQRSKSEGYRSVFTGETIRIDYDNGRDVYEPVMTIDKDEMTLTRTYVKNGIDHGTIKEIPATYGTIAALLFIPGKNSNS